MKICALTMVYRDHWALSQWYAHFARALGPEHLFVVAHGADAELARICPGASIITVPRGSLKGFDQVRGRMLNSISDGLGEVYDWVIRTDADELICLDPDHYPSFEGFFAQQDSRAVFALGLNLAEADGDAPLTEGQRVLGARRVAVFSGHYSKAWAARRGVALMRHGVQLRPRRVARFAHVLPRGVYLVHLKFANLAALEVVNRHRREIASGDERGLPGSAWRKPERDAARFFANLASMPEIDWDKASVLAWGDVQRDPVRDAQTGLVRSRSVRFDFRTSLPAWFGDA